MVDLLLIVNDVIPSRIQDQGVTPVVSSFSQLGGGCSVMGGTDPFLSLVIGKLMGGKLTHFPFSAQISVFLEEIFVSFSANRGNGSDREEEPPYITM